MGATNAPAAYFQVLYDFIDFDDRFAEFSFGKTGETEAGIWTVAAHY
jgi:hypothetical protein